MASHTASELQIAARVFGDAARRLGLEPESMTPPLPEREAALAELDAADAELAAVVREHSDTDEETLSAPFDLERDDEHEAREPVSTLSARQAPFDLERELDGVRAA